MNWQPIATKGFPEAGRLVLVTNGLLYKDYKYFHSLKRKNPNLPMDVRDAVWNGFEFIGQNEFEVEDDEDFKITHWSYYPSFND